MRENDSTPKTRGSRNHKYFLIWMFLSEVYDLNTVPVFNLENLQSKITGVIDNG